MSSNFELWLTDDRGLRLTLLSSLNELFFFSYTRAVSGLGTVSFGIGFREFYESFNTYFQPDWRVEVWRSPAYGIPMRREDAFMLRKPHVYTREDGMEVLQFYGRNGMDLLKRRSVIQRAGTTNALMTDNIDDMMKLFVRRSMLYGSAVDVDGVADNSRAWPQGEFTVQTYAGLGPTVTRDFADRVVFDLCKDLKGASLQLNRDAATNRKIYFDVVPVDLIAGAAASGALLGWEFQTFADTRGSDRTQGIEFSLENENIKSPAYSISHLDEANSVIVRGNGRGLSQIVTSVEDAARIASSRWNRAEKIHSATSETTTTALQDAGRTELNKHKPQDELFVTFLNTPGNASTPRSLYGVDWDLGDLVRVNYAGKQFEAEINVVYVAVDEHGKEEITGRNEIQTV